MIVSFYVTENFRNTKWDICIVPQKLTRFDPGIYYNEIWDAFHPLGQDAPRLLKPSVSIEEAGRDACKKPLSCAGLYLNLCESAYFVVFITVIEAFQTLLPKSVNEEEAEAERKLGHNHMGAKDSDSLIRYIVKVSRNQGTTG